MYHPPHVFRRKHNVSHEHLNRGVDNGNGLLRQHADYADDGWKQYDAVCKWQESVW